MSARMASLAAPLALLVACQPQDLGRVEMGFDGSGDVIEGEFVIQDDLSLREMDELGLEQVSFNEDLGWGLYLAEDGVRASALERALAQGRGTGVEPNRPRAAAAVNDPYYAYQWDMAALGVESAWAFSTGRNVRVAVIDTGVGKTGEDKPKYLLTGKDFVDGDADASDLNGHGSHVAGTIAQATNNGKGCVGVAPDAEILPLRVLDANGSGDAYATAEAIVYAADHGAQVINLSLGSPSSTQVERDAVRYAVDRGVVIVAATGNEGARSVSYPAAYDGVLAVGATRYDGTVTAYSNGGSAVDLVAPGGDTSIDQNGDGYGDGILQEVIVGSQRGYNFFEGTSMATPHVAGAAALLLGAGARPADVAGLLTSTAKDVGAAGWDSQAGYGLIRPVAALEKLRSGAASPPPSAQEEPLADVDAPVISGVWASQTGTSLSIGWTTDEPATSYIGFEGYSQFGNDDLVTRHELRFTVSANATYRFTAVSADAAGNTTEDGVWTTR